MQESIMGRFQNWIDLIKLSMLSALVFAGQTIVSPVLPQYAMTFDVSIALVGWVISSFAVARLGVGLPAGIFSDKIGKKKIMIVGLIFGAVSSMIGGWAPTYFVLVLARVLSGIGLTFYITAAVSWLSHISEGRNRGKMMGLYSSAAWIGMAIGPAVGGGISTLYGIRAPFYSQVLFTIAGIIITTQLDESVLPMSGSTRCNWWNDLKSLASNRSLLFVLLSIFTRFFFNSSFRDTLLPLYASLNLGLGADQIGLLMATMTVIASMLFLPAGWISDRIGRKIQAVTYHLLASLFVLLVPLQSGLEGLMHVVIISGIAQGLYGSIHTWTADVAPSDKIGTAMGLKRFASDLGLFAGSVTVTYFNSFFSSTQIAFEPFVVLTVLGIVTSIVITRARDPHKETLQR
jgi:MFS family permease